jgi:hypothetical protein
MSITAKSAGMSGPLAARLAKGNDEFLLPLIEAEPFYQSLRIKLTFSGSRTKMDGTTEVQEEFGGVVEETFSRAVIPPPETLNLGVFAWVDDEAGTFQMSWLPDGSTLGDGFPFPADGEFYMAIEHAGAIYDEFISYLGVLPDPKKPRHRIRHSGGPSAVVVGTRTITPDESDPDEEEIEWSALPELIHTYSDDAAPLWETNRIPHDVFRIYQDVESTVDIDTTAWSAAKWRDQRGVLSGTWNDPGDGWDSSTYQIAIEVELS